MDISGATAIQPLQPLTDKLAPVKQTLLRFLQMERAVDWTCVGECPSQEELLKLSASPCRCGLEPLKCCPAHACKRGRRGKSGAECTWRRLFAEFIASDSMAAVVSKTPGMLTHPGLDVADAWIYFQAVRG